MSNEHGKNMDYLLTREIKDCTKEICEAMPECHCKLRKKPRGRSAPLEMANSLCDSDCPGYDQQPISGHLWPGELERIKADQNAQ